jgi:hypothetical protein
MSKAEFPTTLASESRFLDRRYLGRVDKRGFSKTLIWARRPDGTRTSHYDPEARLGLYVWKGKNWALVGVYDTRREARYAAGRIRKISNLDTAHA